MRCLQQLSSECDDKEVARVIKEDFFVDDLITGHDDPEILISICEKTSKVLQAGCFPLRKWTLSCDVTHNISKELSIGQITQNKTLGLGWYNSTDELYFATRIDTNNILLTKRGMLATIAQIYDPLGLLAPAIIIAKMLLQKLWLLKIDWDESVPNDVTRTWLTFIDALQCLCELRIPRFVRSVYTERTELHIFTDASQEAYSACAYVRTSNGSNVVVKLLCAKTKVAPLKVISIPKLELCGALIGAKLYEKITESLSLQFDKIIFWTDSTIVLGWLKMSPHLLKTFVQNRVTEINELTGSTQWLHVNGQENPADLVSRGLNLNLLKDLKLWWNGPEFLSNQDYMDSNMSDFTRKIINNTDLPEINLKKVTFVASTVLDLIDFDRFSSIPKLIRSVAYVLRFINNTRLQASERRDRKTGSLSVDELERSQRVVSKFAQMQSFPYIYKCLLNKVPLEQCNNNKKETNRVLGLNVFLDEYGLIRIGGRLGNSLSFDFNKKHPILLCCHHRYTVLLFRYEHKRLMHGGPLLLVSHMRESWWPLKARDLARKIVRECVVCTRMKGKTLTPIMGSLPSARVDPGYPFIRCGVDYAGPVMTLNRKGRGAKLIKGYICLFICFVTRAIHLELVGSLSTNDYIMAFKRFISRRGKPAEMFSDNGKNFVGAEKELNLILNDNHEQISDFSTQNGIKFHRIPIYASNFGGLWESGVKSCKFHLKRVVGNANLNFEGFSTVLTQIEAVLNSRPISPLSSDPNDLLPLTPAHFLIGRPLTSTASADITDERTSSLTRYHRVEQLRQHFWKRWATDYISELQLRTKWKKHAEDIELNRLVLIKEDNLPPLKWRLGRVVRLYTGRDGVSRVADIRTAAGVIQRACCKICPLPVDSMEAEK